MRIVRSLLAFVFVLVGAAAVALVLALYLAATGRSLPVLRAVVGARSAATSPASAPPRWRCACGCARRRAR